MIVPERPNVLVLYADQQRADCLGAYGNSDVKTPALDSLAEGGTVFEECFTTLPVCTPARYSFLSGQPVHEHAGYIRFVASMTAESSNK